MGFYDRSHELGLYTLNAHVADSCVHVNAFIQLSFFIPLCSWSSCSKLSDLYIYKRVTEFRECIMNRVRIDIITRKHAYDCLCIHGHETCKNYVLNI